jgi:hypothetical protein
MCAGMVRMNFDDDEEVSNSSSVSEPQQFVTNKTKRYSQHCDQKKPLTTIGAVDFLWSSSPSSLLPLFSNLKDP